MGLYLTKKPLCFPITALPLSNSVELQIVTSWTSWLALFLPVWHCFPSFIHPLAAGSNLPGKQGCTAHQWAWNNSCVLQPEGSTPLTACMRNREGVDILAGHPVRLKTSNIWSKLGKKSAIWMRFPLCRGLDKCISRLEGREGKEK